MNSPSRPSSPSPSTLVILGVQLGLAASACSTVETRPAWAQPTPQAGASSANEASASSEAELASPPQESEEGADLLGVLLSNGTLTPSQYEALVAAGEAGASPTAKDSSFTVDSKGLRFQSADGESSMKVGGRVQVDGTSHSSEAALDSDIQDGTELRRARFEMKGTLPEDIIWAAEADFANNGTSVKDFWVGLEKEDLPSVVLGHQKQPFSLGLEMSSNDIPFVERGVDSFLVVPFVDRAIGVRAQDSTENLFWAAGIYGDSVSPNSVDDEGWSATARVVETPIQEEGSVLHLAARGSFRVPDGANSIRIRDESTNMSNLRVVDTGVIAGVDSVFLYGLEAVYAQGPYSIGGEYNQVAVDRSGSDYDFDSWHIQGTYTLTGESRADAYRIDSGEFKRLRASSADSRPVELAVRYATLDLNDSGLSGGAEDALTLGINWYYSNNLRLLFDWTRILDTSGGSATTQVADGLDIFGFRAQLNF